MSADYSTHTEADAAISAAHDAYPDPPPIERYEMAGEDPHQWPRELEGPLLEALRAALCDLCGVHPSTDHGLCRACAEFLRDEGAGQ